ncbi:MAG: insulinase family protein [Clostridium sp.]|nr:insulinase family protein [Clostridium sp.]
MISVNRHTLGNGLRIVHHFDPTVTMVAVDVIYNVGSRDEDPSLTGMAHLFEHLMFGGSVNVPDFDGAIENAGGWNNAWTSNDYTNFYDILPAVNAETAFWLESDRMLGLAFSPRSLEIQRDVVIEEFKETCLNKPYGDMSHYLRAMAYRRHPYGYPTIGREIAHIERVTEEDVRRFFYSHYAPNNAVLAVAGNISFERTVMLAQKWFGDIPRRDIAPRLYSPEPPVGAPREVRVEENVPNAQIVVAYPMGGCHDPLYEATDLVSDLLGSGKSSRFYRNLLLGTTLFADIDASILGSDEPGLFLVSARMADNDPSTLKKGREAIRREVARLVEGGCDKRELRRVINRYESNLTFNSVGYLSQAMNMAQAEIADDDINETLERYRRVTPGDISRAARQTLDPSREMTLVYGPKPGNYDSGE